MARRGDDDDGWPEGEIAYVRGGGYCVHAGRRGKTVPATIAASLRRDVYCQYYAGRGRRRCVCAISRRETIDAEQAGLHADQRDPAARGASGARPQAEGRARRASAGVAEAGGGEATPRGAFCTFLLYTGCRLGEAQALTWGDVDLDERQAFIPKTKNGKPRWVHLTPALVQTLGRLHRDRPYVFRRNREDLYRHLDDASRLSGVVIPDGVAFHLFRHTWGTWMRKFGGLDTVGMMATGAWTSRVSAEAYMHASTTPEARKADMLPTW